MNFKKYIIILFSVAFLSGCVSKENYLIKNIRFIRVDFEEKNNLSS